MNLLWKAPALRWRPLSFGLVVGGLYLLLALGVSSRHRPDAEIIIALLVSFMIPLPRHVFSRFCQTDRTEWLMGMGVDRRELAFRYALDLVWWSAVHAAGAALLIVAASQTDLDLFERLGIGRAERAIQMGIAFFLIQLSIRSFFGIAAHLDRSTLVTPRLRDQFNGIRTSLLTTIGWTSLAFLATIVLLGAPIALVAAMGSIYWLAIPAALYLRFVYALAVTSEFVRKATPVDDWGRPVPSSSRPVPREVFAGLRPDRAARAPLSALLWRGLARRMKLVFFTLVGILLVSGIWWAASAPDRRDLPGIFLGLALSLFPVFFALMGQWIFAWNRSDEAVEYLVVRGVALRTLDRIRMAWGLFVAALILGGTLFYHVSVLDGKQWYPAFCALSCLVGAALLLEANGRALPIRIPGCRTCADLGRWVKALSLPMFLLVNGVVSRGLGSELTGKLAFGVGVALLVSAALAWIWSAVPLYLRR